MRINTLISLFCALFVSCTESLRVPYLSRLHKMLLPCQPISKSGERNKAALPKWLLSRDQFPPYWLLSDDLPPWFLAEGPPKWLFEKGFNPPAWMLLDEIPRIITASYGSEGPPLWLLNMDRLPKWFTDVDILPPWLLSFQEVSPPKWALNDSISEWLKRGDIPDWVADEEKVMNIDRWLHNVDEKYPRWMIEGTYPSWMKNIPNKLQNADSHPHFFDSHQTFDQTQKHMEEYRNDQKRALLMKAGNLVLRKKAADVYKLNKVIQKLPDISECKDDNWENWNYHSYGEKAMMDRVLRKEAEDAYEINQEKIKNEERAKDVNEIGAVSQYLTDNIECEDNIWEDWDHYSYGEKAMIDLAIKSEENNKDAADNIECDDDEEIREIPIIAAYKKLHNYDL